MVRSSTWPTFWRTIYNPASLGLYNMKLIQVRKFKCQAYILSLFKNKVNSLKTSKCFFSLTDGQWLVNFSKTKHHNEECVTTLHQSAAKWIYHRKAVTRVKHRATKKFYWRWRSSWIFPLDRYSVITTKIVGNRPHYPRSKDDYEKCFRL